MTDTPVADERTVTEMGDLLLVAGHGQLFTYEIDKPEIVIGREVGCDLRIDHAALSRRHAILRLGPPLAIQDLGSTNGVRVARETHRGGAPVLLEPGESFHLGGFSFNFIGRRHAESSSSHRAMRDRLRVEDPTEQGVPAFARDVARSYTSVLILGETGTGKDVLAETLHHLSGRTGDLARVNCAAIAEPLLESELFGHEKGAFTGANSTKIGFLESAHGGSVFLDEIGELPVALQAKLLRAIEAREILRVGSVRPIAIDVRFISATNRDLPGEVAEKRFRADLYFRLDGITLELPPLRERRGRIAALAAQFFGRAPFSPDVMEALEHHDWPGNVRELKAVVERAVLLARGRTVEARHLVFSSRAPEKTDPSQELSFLTPEEKEQRQELIDALDRCAGNQSRAAKMLGISRTTLVGRIKQLRITRPRS